MKTIRKIECETIMVRFRVSSTDEEYIEAIETIRKNATKATLVVFNADFNPIQVFNIIEDWKALHGESARLHFANIIE